MKSLTHIIIVLTCLGAPCGVLAAEANSQYWVDYHGHYYIKERWESYNDGGYRIVDDGSWMQFYARPSIRYHGPRHWDGRGGLGVFYTYNKGLVDQLEIRPWQGFLYRWPRFDLLSISHYFRLEQRVLFDTDIWKADAELRLRYKIGTKVPLKPIIKSGHVFAPLSVEVFSEPDVIVEQFSNRIRIDMGLGYIFNDIWVGEFHFIVQRSRSTVDESFETSDFIFRFQVKRLVASRDYEKLD